MILLLACGTIDGDGDEHERSGQVECGANAVRQDGACECRDEYTWCEGSREDCCAYDAAYFDVTVHEVVLAPYNYLYYDQPWDWDGDVPDWLLDALDAISLLYPDVGSVAELADLVDEYAPELLEGTVPPDPFFEVYDDPGEITYTSETWGDSYDASFEQAFRVYPEDGTGMLYFWDEDLAFDDEVQALSLPQDDLAGASGRGVLEGALWGNVYWLSIEVDAAF